MAAHRNWPTPAGTFIPGTVHVRVHPVDAVASADADLAAVADAALSAGRSVTVTVPGAAARADMVDWIGRGWRDPALRVTVAQDLLAATAAVFRLWATGADDPVAVLGGFHTVDTGAAGGHDDIVAARWLAAVAAGDAGTVTDLTGLSYAGYLATGAHTDQPVPAPTTVCIGTRFRRNGIERGLRGVMGGAPLIDAAATVVAVAADPTGVDRGEVAATATVLKAPVAAGDTITVTRPVDVLDRRTVPLFWQARRGASRPGNAVHA
jgi:hypothetical protein